MKDQNCHLVMTRSVVTTNNGNLNSTKHLENYPPEIDGYRTFSHVEYLNGYKNKYLKDTSLPGPDIDYKLNRHFFRTENFEKIDNEFINILVAGCSWTFGQGVANEHIWHSFLSKRIEMETGKKVKVHNLGVMGGSTHLAIKNVISFINLYGKPDYVFLLLPGWTRDIRFLGEKQEPINVSIHMPINKDKDQRKVIELFVERHDDFAALNTFVTSMQLLELFLNSANINFVWTSTNLLNQKAVGKRFEFSNYREVDHVFDKAVSLLQPISDVSVYPNTEGLDYWALSKDGSHPGVAFHHDLARIFFEEASF